MAVRTKVKPWNESIREATKEQARVVGGGGMVLGCAFIVATTLFLEELFWKRWMERALSNLDRRLPRHFFSTQRTCVRPSSFGAAGDITSAV